MISKGVKSIFPIKNQEIWERYKQHIQAFWTTEEVSLQDDLRDLETLNANFIHSTETNIFITLLTNPNYIHTTARYLDKMFQCRESLLQKHKNFT